MKRLAGRCGSGRRPGRRVKDVLLDVTPLSLGIETLGGIPTHHRAEHNHTTRKSQIFTTAEATRQASKSTCSGERELARDNRTLGRFHLIGLPPAPRGLPQVEVTFDIDANGILHVTAKDMATSKEQNITITASTGLTEQDIQNMVKDAEAHSEEDKKRREEIEVRNQLDNLVYGTEKRSTRAKTN
jgi:molecular chaperone DnaK